MARDYGAFMEKFTIIPPSSSQHNPLHTLTFAVKDIFDMEGYVTGFGNPDWARTHSAAESTAPAVMAVLNAGATCVGKTVMDEMAYSIDGENKHYGTPTNPCAPDYVPGGSSSGSAVAVRSVRVPASYCGIFGFRPSHGLVSTTGVIPLAQSFDTVGWFARDPATLHQVGIILLQLPKRDPVKLSQIIVPEDCFQLLSIPTERVSQVLVNTIKKFFGGDTVKNVILGDYVKDNVPSLKHFISKETKNHEYDIPSLAALSSAMRMLERYEFKNNYAEWVTYCKPDLGPGICERVWEAVNSSDENINICWSAKTELRSALEALLGDCGVLALPTVSEPPPKLQTEPSELQLFRARAFSLLSIAGVSGFCQVSIPLGFHDNLPVAVSLIAKHGSDGFLLGLIETIHETLKEEIEIAEKMNN
ncbi:Amidase signature domain [Dillenia turbinata]|uniref:Amidase signature domain n=1 Tax=Dillenia turbinata TaxID=194707 RepID=A0AAN8U9Y6_9MAGN